MMVDLRQCLEHSRCSVSVCLMNVAESQPHTLSQVITFLADMERFPFVRKVSPSWPSSWKRRPRTGQSHCLCSVQETLRPTEKHIANSDSHLKKKLKIKLLKLDHSGAQDTSFHNYKIREPVMRTELSLSHFITKKLYTNYTMRKNRLHPPKLQYPTYLWRKISFLFPLRRKEGF